MKYRFRGIYILGGKSYEYVSDVQMLRELVYIKHFAANTVQNKSCFVLLVFLYLFNYCQKKKKKIISAYVYSINCSKDYYFSF